MAKISIDAGHGLYTSGKRCLKSLDKNETREWVLNSRIATEVGRLPKSAGHTVIRVDDTDGSSDISLASRVSKANSWGADFYISIHHNAGVKGGSGGGTEVYVCKGCQAKSTQAQEAIYKATIARAGLKGNRSDGTKSANFYVVKYTKMPACLIECGFMDSKTDIKYILDPEWAMKMARGIAEGICDVFGGEIDAVVSKPVDTTSDELTVDGIFGKDTARKSQKVFGTVQDGKISNQPIANKKYLPNCSTSAWEFKGKNYKGGSAFIKALQLFLRKLEYYTGAIDGYCGKQTVTALQMFLKKLGYYTGAIDGYCGRLTVIAWQLYINSRL